MSVSSLKQKYEPQYRTVRFKTEKEFWRWLSATSKYCIHFEDRLQDCLKWWIDEGGEVLHADMQSAVWNGQIVDLSRLKVGKNVGVMDTPNQQTKFYDFVVSKVEKVTNRK